MNERIQNLYTGLVNATGVPGEIEKLKVDAAELKQDAKAYLSAQMTLQVISTLAMVGMFWLALRESNKRKG
jgi:hypothetical protein